MKNLIRQHKLISDTSKYQHDTSLEIYQKLHRWLKQDFPEKYTEFIERVAEQYQKEFRSRKDGKPSYKGYELMGSGISRFGSQFALADLAIVDIVLSPIILDFSKTERGWNWIRKNILEPKVSVKNPTFTKRSTIPLLLELLKNRNRKNVVIKWFKNLISIRLGIPRNTEVIFEKIIHNIDDFNPKDLTNLIKEDLRQNNLRLPSSIFEIITLFELMKRDNKNAQKIFFGFIKDPKSEYFKYDDFNYNTLDHFHIIADNADLQGKILEKFLASKKWGDIKGRKFILEHDLPEAFYSFVLAKAKCTNNLNFLEEFLKKNKSIIQKVLVYKSLHKLAQELPLETTDFLKSHFPTMEEKWFWDDKNSYTRELVVEVGQVLADKALELNKKIGEYSNGKEKQGIKGEMEKLTNNIYWIINKFIDDLDPKKDNGEFDYDKKIRKGEDPNVITSVRGKLAWVIQKLALRKETLEKAFKYIQQFLKYSSEEGKIGEDNLYIVQQTLISLVEVVRRRNWLREIDPKLHNSLHNLLFDLLRDKKFRNKEDKIYPALARYLLNAFSYYRELDEKQAKEVLENLGHVDDSIVLFIYFALYRKDHFGKKFKSTSFEELLKQKIQKGNNNLRKSLTWHFRKILDEKPKEFGNLKNYIDLFAKRFYSSDVFLNLIDIINDQLEQRPKEYIDWFDSLIDKALKFFSKDKKAPINIWFDSEKAIGKLATIDIKRLLKIMKNIHKLWMLGAYVGDIKTIFESYQFVKNTNEKKIVVDEFQQLYNRMKKENPKLAGVDWNK